MILPPRHINAHLLSTWTAAVCTTVLGVGFYGAAQPVMPVDDSPPLFLEIGEDVEFVEFQAPGDPGPAEEDVLEEEDTPIEEVIEDVEIPPLPEIVEPLTPPEMQELTPLEEIRQPEPPKMVPPKPAPEKPKPEKPRPVRRKPQSAGTGTGTGGGGGSGPPTVFSGAGKGRFPAPTYPAAARSAGHQGTVRVLVVVEESGMPSACSVQISSGSSYLDSSAVSTISRRWRWPKGPVRRYIVPVRFVLNQ